MKLNILRDHAPTDGGVSKVAPIQLPQSQLTKVEMPKDPPKEVLDMNFSTEQLPVMDKSEGGPTPADNKGDAKPVAEGDKKVADVKVDEKKVEVADDKKVVDDKKVDDKKVDDKLGLPKYLKPPKDKEEPKKDDKSDGIDYTKFSAAEGGYLKNMSREARAFTADLITQNRELSKLKGGTYLQHPDAYTLSPEWKGAVEQVTSAQTEGEAWKTCLAQIKEGKPFRPPISYDAKGNLVYGPETKPTDSLEEEVRLAMQNCFKTATEVTGQMRVYASNHKKNVDNDLGVIETERKARFEWARNPELLEYSVSVKDDKGVATDKTLKQIQSDFTNLFPTYLRDNVGVRVGADLMVSLIIARAELEEARATKNVVQTKLDEQKLVEPSSDSRPGQQPEPVGGVREFNMNGVDGL